MDKEKLILNCCGPDENGPQGFADDDRVYYAFNLAFNLNESSSERIGVIYWFDPARRRIEVKQAPKP